MKVQVGVCYLCLGIIIITLSFIMLLNFDIREWNVRTIFKAQINLNEVVKLVKNYNENKPESRPARLEHDFKEILNGMEHDSYLYLYCQIREPERKWVYHPRQEFPITTTQPNLITLESDRRIMEQQLFDRLQKKKFYLKSIYSYLICQSEKVYFLLIILCTLIGSALIICGAIKVYINIYEFKGKKRIRNEENGAEEEGANEEEAEVEGCCLSALLKTLYTEVSPRSPTTTTQTNSNSAFSRFEANMIRPDNSFMLLKQGLPVPPNNLNNSIKSSGSLQPQESSYTLSAGNNQQQQQQRKNERMAPFIYEDLPDFYKNQASNSSETCSYLNTSFMTPQSSFDFGNKHQNRRSFNGRQSFESRQSNPRSFMNAQNSLETYHMRAFLQLPENQYGDVALPMSSVPSLRSSMNGPPLLDNESNLSSGQKSKKVTSRKNSDRLSVPTAILLSDEFSDSPRVLSDHAEPQQPSQPVHKKKKNKLEKASVSSANKTQVKIVRTGADLEADYTECNL